MMDFDQYVTDTYDSIVSGKREDGMKVGDARAEIVKAAKKAITDKALDAPAIDAAVGAIVNRVDTRRRADLPEAILYAAAAKDGETILDFADDPSLSQAFPVGSGVRKALRYCTSDDLDAMVAARRENMAQVVASFNVFAAGVDKLKATMKAHDAHIVDDLIVRPDSKRKS